ncbi:hypothetical protein [Gemmobacter nectariphilus]|uniref:hypothetical protein n=1 Tax=Gemmobacter nectariphilus TaxID=220343 RepID=UPI00041A6A0D|nr:hypothetical protein [Gemmobacter nectariphilus]
MKNLLLTSALAVAGLGFASGAMAQTITDGSITTAGELSLLERILANQAELQASMLNAAENYANLDGSINVDVNMNTLLTGLALGVDPAVEGSGVSATGFVKSISFTDTAQAVDFYDPSTVASTMGNLATTVIGSLGTGTIGQTASASTADGVTGNTTSSSSTLTGVNLALLDVASNAQAITSTSQAYSTTMVTNPGLVQVANIAGNYSQTLNGGINLTFADSLAKGGDMSTTVIGALGTGNIAASLQRNLIGTSGVAGTY